MEITPIAHIYNAYDTKFGIPRQSGLVPELMSQIVFEPAYRNPDALRGIEGFERLWLIWQFSEARQAPWRPTVRPPRLGGNTRVGVFASRSPFRPNHLGLSCVQLVEVLQDHRGPVLSVAGADLMNGTPIFDIKPYSPEADAYPGARAGFVDAVPRQTLAVECPPALLEPLPEAQRQALLGVLAQDPRPSYQHDPERVYGMRFAGHELRFRVRDGVLRVLEVES